MSKVIRFGHGGIPESKFSILATNCPVQKHGIRTASPNSIDRFWNVVFSSERVDGIVVLGNADGNNIIDYWNPARVGDPTFYDKESYYTIESCIQEETSFYKKYKIIINSKGSNVKKTIDLWHYTDWPDGEGPTNPDNFERFVKMFVESRKLVVHCSAGVGRTGVFAGCVAAWKLGSGANPKEIVELMREARTHMVQKPGQFDILCKFTLRNCYGEAVSWSETLSEETVCRLCGIPRVVKES